MGRTSGRGELIALTLRMISFFRVSRSPRYISFFLSMRFPLTREVRTLHECNSHGDRSLKLLLKIPENYYKNKTALLLSLFSFINCRVKLQRTLKKKKKR